MPLRVWWVRSRRRDIGRYPKPQIRRVDVRSADLDNMRPPPSLGDPALCETERVELDIGVNDVQAYRRSLDRILLMRAGLAEPVLPCKERSKREQHVGIGNIDGKAAADGYSDAWAFSPRLPRPEDEPQRRCQAPRVLDSIASPMALPAPALRLEQRKRTLGKSSIGIRVRRASTLNSRHGTSLVS
jgi:hypothetical protein